jgi:DNA-binding CsgD family transcriptional regulator/tetratricopeptide (TPR) repeat protein
MEAGMALRLSGSGPGDIDRAAGAGVLLAEKGRLRFRHEIAREAMEEALPPGRRLHLHREMIELLLTEETPDPSRLAHHAIRGEEGALVIRFAPEAARRASRAGAHREAARLLEDVVDYPDLLDPDRVAELRLQLAHELALLDRYQQALANVEEAVAHYRSRPDRRVELANALVAGVATYWSNRRRAEAREVVDEAIQILEIGGPTADLAGALHRSGYLWMLNRKHRAAIDDIVRALEVAAAVGAEERILASRLILGTIELVTGDPARGVEVLEEVYGQAARLGDSRHMVLSAGMLGSGGGEARLYQVAQSALDRSITVGLQHDEDYSVAYARAWKARIAFEQGRWEEALTYADMVPPGPSESSAISPVTALGAKGRVLVRRGDPQAGEVLFRALAIGEGCEMQHLWPPLCGLAELAFWEGGTAGIPHILEWVYGEALASDSPWARGEVGFWMWKAGAIDSPPTGAAEPFALHMSGDYPAAARAWAELGCPYEQALALAETDRPGRLEALSIFDRLGAGPAARWLRSRLRQEGPVPRGPRPATRNSPLGLTSRQGEVLKLMMEGLNNAEIAARLFISKKTTEHHVSAILARLGVASRAAAIARAAAGSEDGGSNLPI